jgi:hypothetical protein
MSWLNIFLNIPDEILYKLRWLWLQIGRIFGLCFGIRCLTSQNPVPVSRIEYTGNGTVTGVKMLVTGIPAEFFLGGAGYIPFRPFPIL